MEVRELARKIRTYYDNDTAIKAENHFNTVVVKKGIPADMPKFSLKKSETALVNVIFESGLLKEQK